MTKFFTSDTHFGHGNIIRYCSRPFVSLQQMDDKLVDNWNKKVTKAEDEVYHIGDFSFSPPDHYLPRLNGKIYFLFGNHDKSKYWSIPRWSKHHEVTVLGHYHELKLDDTHITLCHYAMRVWNKSHHGSLMFYGHSHSTLPGNDQSVDVGVDNFNFEPVTLSEIKKRLKMLPSYRLPDHHSPKTK